MLLSIHSLLTDQIQLPVTVPVATSATGNLIPRVMCGNCLQREITDITYGVVHTYVISACQVL